MHPDLKIKIPRFDKNCVHSTSAEKYWGLVRKHGRSRKAMVDFICSIGGYSDRHTRFAIEFNIKAYRADLDVDNLWELLCSGKVDVGPDLTLSPEDLAKQKALFWRLYARNKDDLFDWGCEAAYRGFAESDVVYETFTGERVTWEWEVVGRSGGHLCMTDCEGYSLQCSPEDFKIAINGDEHDEPWPHAVVRKLFIICVQNSVDLNPVAVSAEVEYQAAWFFWASIVEPEWEQLVEEEKKVAKLTGQAQTIYGLLAAMDEGTGALPESFLGICKAAGLGVESIIPKLPEPCDAEGQAVATN